MIISDFAIYVNDLTIWEKIQFHSYRSQRERECYSENSINYSSLPSDLWKVVIGEVSC